MPVQPGPANARTSSPVWIVIGRTACKAAEDGRGPIPPASGVAL
jgi:hypothetical protein